MSLDKFTAWMVANDVARPVVVSETAMTERWRADLLLEYVASKVDDSTIHAAIWYSDADYWQLWPQSDLRTEAGELTELGELYVGLSEDEVAQPSEARRLWLPAMYP